MNLPRLTYDQSKRAYELGFRADTEWWFPFDRIPKHAIHFSDHDGITEDLFANPENALFLQWCREVKGVFGLVSPFYEFRKFVFGICVVWFQDGKPLKYNSDSIFVIHQQAETALIEYLFDLLEKKTK